MEIFISPNIVWAYQQFKVFGKTRSWSLEFYDAVVPSDIVMGIRIKLRYDAVLSLSLTLPIILHTKILLLSGHPLEVRKTTIQLPA